MINKFNHPLFSWHFEVSSKCHLACPRCPRTMQKERYKVTELNLNFFKNIFDEKFIQDNMERILFCGGQGDPIYCTEFLDIIKYFKTIKPTIAISITTNGSNKSEEWWKRLNEMLNEYDNIVFSVDGWDQESNNNYRVNNNFDSIISGIKIMTTGKAIIRWSTILFKFNQHKIKDIENLAKSIGVNYFDLTFSMLFGSHDDWWINPTLGYDPLEPDKKYVSRYSRNERYFEELNFKEKKITKELTQKTNHYHELWMNKIENMQVLPLCMTNNRGTYIDAEGILYPCSWVSHPFGIRKSAVRDKIIHWDESLWVKYKNKWNLNIRSLKDILNDDDIWQPLFNGWKAEKDCFIECEQKCKYKERYVRKKLKSIL